jgi:pyrroline-5-carboxylate reductase
MKREAALKLGFIGTGTISAAVIHGIGRAWGDGNEIVISPRSTQVSQALAERYSWVRRAESNQAVIDASDIVFLGVMPHQAAEVIGALRLREGQTLASFVAGLEVAALQKLSGPDVLVCRVTPLPPIAHLEGPVMLYPGLADVRQILAPLGVLIEPDSDEAMAALSTASGLMSSFFRMSQEAVGWLEARGLPRVQARDYVMAMFAALSKTALRHDPATLEALPREHETTGGINEACRAHLEEQGWFEAFARSMDAIDARARKLGD